MKKVAFFQIFLVVGLFFVGCGKPMNVNGPQNSEEASVYFAFTLPTNNGNSMTKNTNAEIFDEFYQKIKDASLVAPSYDLTLTEVNTGAVYKFSGRWLNHDKLTIKSGTYNVVGTSTAEGAFIQEKCSFSFDEQIVINAKSSVITLSAIYDCFLLIFSDADISEIQNNSGSVTESFFSLNTYQYAFVNYLLYDVNIRDDAYIAGTFSDNSSFRIFTDELNFEKGKYYVYDSMICSFDVPVMEEGDSTEKTEEQQGGSDNISITLPPDNEVWYTSITGKAIQLCNYPGELVSNKYENGKGVYKFKEAVTDISNYFGDRGNPLDVVLDFESIIFPKSITTINEYIAMGALKNAKSLVLPEGLDSIGTDIICGFGENLDKSEIKHIYFLSENCPSTSWRSLWNLHGTYYVHYPKDSDYSAINNCMQSWTTYENRTYSWTMVETEYEITYSN